MTAQITSIESKRMTGKPGSNLAKVAATISGRMSERTDGPIEYIDVTDCAKLMRAALKDEFPGTKFSVRSESYSGGAHVNVEWTDGPTTKQVETVLAQFRGSEFDGMMDLKSSVIRYLNGRRVNYLSDWPSLHRKLSAALLRQCAEQIAREYNVAAPKVTISTHTWHGKTWESVNIDTFGEPLDRYASGAVSDYSSTAGNKALQLAYQTPVEA